MGIMARVHPPVGEDLCAPSPPVAGALDRDQINLTDAESRIMKRFGERQRRAESGSDGVEFEADVCLDGVDEGTKAG